MGYPFLPGTNFVQPIYRTAEERLNDRYEKLMESLDHFGQRSGLRPELIAEAREIRFTLEAKGWAFPNELPTV